MHDEDKKLQQMARRVLVRNRRHDGSYQYTCPARQWYDQQWLWDSCFHAIALSTFDADAAKAELRSLMAGLREDGFLPNVIMRYRPKTLHNRLFALLLFKDGISNITQPPMVAVALERVYLATRDKEYLRELLPKVKAFFAYLRTERDPEQSGLVTIIHPWEAGIDSTPAFDALLGIRTQRPSMLRVYAGFYQLLLRDALEKWNIDKIIKARTFAVKHVLFNCIYAQGLLALSRLCKQLGEDTEATFYEQLANRTTRVLINNCWNEKDGLFYSVSGGQQLAAPTISSLFPLILPSLPRRIVDRLVREHLTSPLEYWTPYPVATVSVQSPTFNPFDSKTVLWRGPVWVNANWFIIKALHLHGYHDVARELTDKTKHLLAQHHKLYEFYNPLTGGGEGQGNYAWSALILDLL